MTDSIVQTITAEDVAQATPLAAAILALLWFRDRYRRFVYIDRIAVAASARGRGLARLLYCELFDQAHRRGHLQVACGVNLAPPNPASDAFHAALGFVEVGRARIHGGSKTVRYLRRTLEVTGGR